MSDTLTRRTRPQLVAVLTVMAWNALAVALLVIWAVIAGARERAHPSDPEGWSGLVLAIAFMFVGAAIVASAVVGVVVTLVRSNRNPTWMAPTATTGQAMLAGTRLAAWGLLVIVPVILLFVHPWAS